MDDKTTSSPIVCTLPTDKQRLEINRIKNEIIPYIINHKNLKNGAVFTLAVDATLMSKIETLVELDKGCCTFLSHLVEKTDKNIVWTIKSERAGSVLAQDYLSKLMPVQKSRLNMAPTKMGLKALAILAICGFACTAPLLLGLLGISVAGIGLSALGMKFTALGVTVIIAIIVSAYWYYLKRSNNSAKGQKNENQCSC